MSYCTSDSCLFDFSHTAEWCGRPQVPMRPDWDDYFLGIALAVSRRGDCRRRQHGAVLVDRESHQILSCGYNGTSEPGQPGCLEGACPRGLKSYAEIPSLAPYTGDGFCIAVHAEMNAIKWYEQGKLGWATDWVGKRMYITGPPCDDCQQQMIVRNIEWRYP